MTWPRMPGPQLREPEEFRATWAQTWHNYAKPFLAANVVVALLCFMIGYVVGGYVGCVLLPVAVVGGVTLLQRVASRGHGLRLSPTGVEFLRRDGVVVRMRWPDIQGVVVINRRSGTVIAPYGVGRAAAQAGADMFADANTGPGLTGVGEILSADQAARQRQLGPAWVAMADPQTVHMSLILIDRAWTAGRIGDWLRHYRPGLLP
ncbi:hypothetical protein Dvina_06315 [Dactylosporangium vinaceum]|uniref:PH domain-containing protein n=1 Tax=Dactylosporangium vinaceum TaxID=53362 RepID=A0ABV5M655_9ACTN|nr:hypothetical protein [Dactylosporangium vinaceum]UAB97735.1 hypothetical protein Dvina_06315 [Dactylosporangium vinaceum]